MESCADVQGVAQADLDVTLHADLEGLGAVHLLVEVADDVDVLVLLDLLVLVALDDEMAVAADPLVAVAADPLVLVHLGVDADLLAALGVVNGDLVVAAAALGGVGLDAGARLLAGEAVRGHLDAVVDGAGDDGPVGVALDEIDDDLLPDARDVDGAPVLAGPRLGDADPARGGLVGLAAAVPVELDFDPPVLVGVDLLARGADDDGGLAPLDDGLGGGARGPELDVRWDGGEVAGEEGALARAGLGVVFVGMGVQAGRDDEVLAVLILARVVGEGELVAGADPASIGGARDDLVVGAELLHPHPRVGLAVAKRGVLAGVVVDLEVRAEMAAGDRGAGLEVPRRVLAVEVVVDEGAGPHGLAAGPVADALEVGRGLAGRTVGDLGVLAEGLVRRRRVAQHHRVLAVLVGEEVVDALLLHQAADEVEVGLAVLDAVPPLAVGAGEAVVDVGEPVVLEHLLDDVRDLPLLEDAAVGGAGEEPDGRDHGGPVGSQAPATVELGEAADHAVDVPRAALRAREAHRHVLADDVVEADGVVFAQQVELVAGQAAEALGAGDAAQEQGVRTERRAEGEAPVSLGSGHQGWLPFRSLGRGSGSRATPGAGQGGPRISPAQV